jgi:DNA-binding CsgD family transcriptional regulator
MELDKPTYVQIEKELNEYKELLWQLSDEYKVNLGNAEKLVAEEKEKYKELEKSIGIPGEKDSSDFLSLLGLPACILDNSGNVSKHNNKFKFLIELLGFEIEDINNISVLFKKGKTSEIQERFDGYVKSDDGLLQSLFSVENQFQSTVNLVVRVYRSENENQHLALFVELSANEVKSLCSGISIPGVQAKAVNIEKSSEIVYDDLSILKTDIAIFTEKFELLEDISKSAEFSNDKNEISSALLQSIKRTFNLDNLRNKILEKLQLSFKTFIFQINHKYPELTNNEEKHCMLIKAGLTYKEIAAIMGVSINGVKIARNRLRKKFDLENETKTSDFIDNIF